MNVLKKSAFTLIEMIIAITVFTIFIGFSISAYLTFHRADQEALTTRTLIMSAQGVMSALSDTIRESSIAYDSLSMLSTSELHLLSADGDVETVYVWDSVEETLSMQTFDSAGDPLTDAVLLHSENTTVSYVSFSIFPSENPRDNPTEDALQYQPFVTIDLSFSMPGRVREEVTMDLHTSVTTRFYQ